MAIELSFDAGRHEWFCPYPGCDLLIACDIEGTVVGFAETHLDTKHQWDTDGTDGL